MVAHSAIEQVRGTPPRSPSPPGGGTDRERRAAASGENDTTALRKDVGLETPPELTVAHRKRMAELSDMVVDELAFAFGVELREALKGCDQQGDIARCEPFTTDAYLQCVLAHRQRPAVFSSPTEGAQGYHVHEALRRGPIEALKHACEHSADAKLMPHWPQLELPDEDVSPADFLAFFAEPPPARAPPNVIDDRISKLGVCGGEERPRDGKAVAAPVDESRAYTPPLAYRLASMLARPDDLDDQHEVADTSDLVLSPTNAVTRFHIDSGFSGLCDLVSGEKLWALCSLSDGVSLGLLDGSAPPTVQAFMRAPSACVVRLRAGEMLFIPSGWWHFVVTTAPSLGFSSNGLAVGGMNAARRCLCTREGVEACQLDDQMALARLDITQRGGLKRHLRNQSAVLGGLERLGASAALLEQYSTKLAALAVEFRLVSQTADADDQSKEQVPSTPPRS